MTLDVDQWLSQLPFGEAEAGEGLLLSCDLLAENDSKVQIRIGELILTFSRADLLDLEPLAERGGGPSYRILVRRGARLWGADLLNAAPAGKRPFALMVRPPHIVYSPSPRFRAMEHDFLRRHGLLDQ